MYLEHIYSLLLSLFTYSHIMKPCKKRAFIPSMSDHVTAYTFKQLSMRI